MREQAIYQAKNPKAILNRYSLCTVCLLAASASFPCDSLARVCLQHQVSPSQQAAAAAITRCWLGSCCGCWLALARESSSSSPVLCGGDNNNNKSGVGNPFSSRPSPLPATIDSSRVAANLRAVGVCHHHPSSFLPGCSSSSITRGGSYFFIVLALLACGCFRLTGWTFFLAQQPFFLLAETHHAKTYYRHTQQQQQQG